MTIRRTLAAAAVGLAAAWAVPAAAQQNPTVTARDRAPCRDPWVNIAIRELKGRAPHGSNESGECNVQLYNSASWNNYAELKRHVADVFRALDRYDAHFDSDGTFVVDDDYTVHRVPLRDVRVWSARAITDGFGNNSMSSDGANFRGAIGLPGGVTIRFARG